MKNFLLCFLILFPFFSHAEELKFCPDLFNCTEEQLNHAVFFPKKGITKSTFEYKPSHSLIPSFRHHTALAEPEGCVEGYEYSYDKWYQGNETSRVQGDFLDLNQTYRMELDLESEHYKNCEKVTFTFKVLHYDVNGWHPYFNFNGRGSDLNYLCKTGQATDGSHYEFILKTLEVDSYQYSITKIPGNTISSGIFSVISTSCYHYNSPGCVKGSLKAIDYKNPLTLMLNGNTGLFPQSFGQFEIRQAWLGVGEQNFYDVKCGWETNY
jgi:hypothetical protein